MSNPGVPVGQNAYQNSFVAGYGAAMAPMAQTSNRYSGGSAAFAIAVGGDSGPIGGYPQRIGRRTYWRPGMGGTGAGGTGGANAVTSTVGTGYAVSDIVTFNPVNRGRPIVVKILTAPAGVPGSWLVLDPGSGLPLAAEGKNLLSPTNPFVVLTQNGLSVPGGGSGSVWHAFPGFGWPLGQPNPLA